jgi:hypothetical protein
MYLIKKEISIMQNSRLQFSLSLIVLSLLVSPFILLTQACGARESKPAQAKPLSFEAVTFTGADPAFTLKYPRSWIIKPVQGKSVLYASAADDRAADSFSVFVSDPVDDVASTIKNGIETLPAFVENKATANIKSVMPAVMADGKTEATVAVLTAKVATYDIWFYCYAFNQDGKTVCFIGDTMGGDSSRSLIKEIAYTLASK